jgi:rod shape determining protein RodA
MLRSGGSILARADGVILLAWIGLLVIGLAALYSCTVPYQSGDGVVPSNVDFAVFLTQLMWVLLGLAVGLICIFLPFRFFETFAYLFYAGAVILLVAVFVMGEEQGGARRWLSFGPVGIQPSELAKVALVCVLGRHLAGRRSQRPTLKLAGALFLALPPFLLVLKEPDLGTALALLALPLPMLYWAGIRARFLLALASPLLGAFVMFYGQQTWDSTIPWVLYLIALLAIVFFSRMYMLRSLMLVGANVLTGLSIALIWERLRPYQQERIVSFLRPTEADLLGSGYQALQSKVAIGSGGLLGKGYLQGSQKGLAFLPERHTDFIFSVVGEEFGLFGALLVLALFALLLHRALRVAVMARRPFASLLAVGVATYFCFQAFVNIGITVGLLPVTGLPLPFISKGGSSMLASSIMMGLLLNVSARWSEV